VLREQMRTICRNERQPALSQPPLDKSTLAVPAPRRRNKVHLRCCAAASRPTRIISGSCSRGPWAAKPATSSRSRFAVSIIHHRLVHRVGNEPAWWQEAGIDPIAIARKLWEHTLEAEARKPATLRSGAPDRVSPSDGAGNAPA
jgi:hypothetical protein